MDDELRKLERDAARGDPAAIQRLAAARIRAARIDGIWQQFDYAFDLVQLRPWDLENVKLLKNICTRIPATEPASIQDGAENVVIDQPMLGEDDQIHPDITASGLRNVVIKKGVIGYDRLHNCSRVVVMNGTFAAGALNNTQEMIILDGLFLTNLEGGQNVTIVNGRFDQSLFINSNVLILDGTFRRSPAGYSLTILGGTFKSTEFTATSGTNMHAWLPQTNLGIVTIPTDAVVVGKSVEYIGADEDVDPTRNADIILGTNRTARTAFYLASCPKPENVARNLKPLFFTAPAWDILPLLNADKGVNRTNIAAWIDAQAERLRQNATPCFPH